MQIDFWRDDLHETSVYFLRNIRKKKSKRRLLIFLPDLDKWKLTFLMTSSVTKHY